MAPAVLATLITSEETSGEVMKEVNRMRRSGELLTELGTPALEKFMKRASGMMDDPEIPPGVLARVADTVFKMTGLAEERAVRLRREAGEAQPFVSLVVSYDGDPELPPEKPGELRLAICAPAGVKRPERVTTGEVVDGDA